jgi:hypothetical protein
MSKKLTIAEKDFLVDLISNKIADKKKQQIREVVEKNPTYLELQKRVDHINSLRDQLREDYEKLEKELCDELGMSGGYGDRPTKLDCSYKVELKVDSISSYDVSRKVREKVMYEQVVLGGISEDFVTKIVNELS